MIKWNRSSEIVAHTCRQICRPTQQQMQVWANASLSECKSKGIFALKRQKWCIHARWEIARLTSALWVLFASFDWLIYICWMKSRRQFKLISAKWHLSLLSWGSVAFFSSAVKFSLMPLLMTLLATRQTFGVSLRCFVANKCIVRTCRREPHWGRLRRGKQIHLYSEYMRFDVAFWQMQNNVSANSRIVRLYTNCVDELFCWQLNRTVWLDKRTLNWIDSLFWPVATL